MHKLLKYLDKNWLTKGHIKVTSDIVPSVYYKRHYPKGTDCSAIVNNYFHNVERKFIIDNAAFGEALKRCIYDNTAADVIQLVQAIEGLDCLNI